jgi:hypothetical protein
VSEYREITPECRTNRGDYPAYDQAAHDLWHVYGVMLARHPDATFVLTLTRKPEPQQSSDQDPDPQR